MRRAIIGFETETPNYKSTAFCSCRVDQIKSIDHILFECGTLNECRDQLWKRVVEVAPRRFISDINETNIKNKTVLILSGLGGNYLPEFEVLYTEILLFTVKLISMSKNL